MTPDYLPPGLALPLAVLAWLAYLVVRARQERPAGPVTGLRHPANIMWCSSCNGWGTDERGVMCQDCKGFGAFNIDTDEPHEWPPGLYTVTPLTDLEVDAFIAEWEAARG